MTRFMRPAAMFQNGYKVNLTHVVASKQVPSGERVLLSESAIVTCACYLFMSGTDKTKLRGDVCMCVPSIFVLS